MEIQCAAFRTKILLSGGSWSLNISHEYQSRDRRWKQGWQIVKRRVLWHTEPDASFPQLLGAGKLLGDTGFILLREISLSLHPHLLKLSLNHHVFLNSILKFFSNMLCSISCPRYLLHVKSNIFHLLSALSLQKLRRIFCSLKLVNLLLWFISKMPVEALHFAMC